MFTDGKEVGRVVGFEDIQNEEDVDDVSETKLEALMGTHGVVKMPLAFYQDVVEDDEEGEVEW